MDADLKNFTPATQRVLSLKKQVLYAAPEICIERAKIITESDKRYSA